MTIRNLEALFRPKSIALVGASNQPHSVGAALARNLLEAGFSGPILTVNPHEQAIRSTLNYHSVADLPITPDLAVIATPAAAVPKLIAELGSRGCRAAVIVTGGFGESEHAGGRGLRDQMLAASKPHLLRILGPNSLGLISPAVGINASFAHLTPPAGDLAFLTQSGALATSIIDWASPRGYGFSHVVSLGDMSDVDFGDLLDYLALDAATRAILLYVESVSAARKFMSAGRIAARTKPVIVLKSGRSAAGARAALSHTGALAGADAVYDAAFRRAGMLRVYELRELFEAVTTLAAGMKPGGDRLGVVTNGGGAGVLATDALEDYGGTLAELSAETSQRFDEVLPADWSHTNPVDIIGDANGERYERALAIALADSQFDAVLVMNCPTAVADSLDAARATLSARDKVKASKPMLTCWLGEPAAAASRRFFTEHGLPTFETPDEAVRAFMHLVQYRRNQDLLLETPPASLDVPAENREKARAICRAALAAGRSILTEPEAKELVQSYGIPVVETLVVATPEEARAQASRMAGPFVLKILSPDITHKSDVGGVRLDLGSPEAVEQAARDILESVRSKSADAQIFGFTIEPMVNRPQDHELILGIAEDRTFGPVLLFGQGGVGAEIVNDRAIGLPPLNPVLAREMIARTRAAKLLAGYRNRPAADLDAISTALVSLSALLVDIPEISELDINPLLAGPDGVLALDARVILRGAENRRPPLAIEPYPADLERTIVIDGGLALTLRPIRPDDEGRLSDMVARSSSEHRRLRFLGSLSEFPHVIAARLSQIDYDREMALVAHSSKNPPPGEILGVARIVANPDYDEAEFAVMVRSDMQGRGLGYQLMQAILDCARRRGVRTVYGDVLAENRTMLSMAAELGFIREDAEAGVVHVSIPL
jgi:acetyltransferase